MKAARYFGKGDLRVVEAPKPEPGTGEVRIRVRACGVCGTDRHIYLGEKGAAECLPPKTLGHEFAGTVDALGVGVTGLAVGDSVCVDPNRSCGGCAYCRNGLPHFCERMSCYGTTLDGGFAEYAVVDARQALAFGGGLPFEEAAMAEALACCLHGLDLAGIKAGQDVLVVGAGTIGSIMVQLASLSGAARVVAVDPVREKRGLAVELGATAAVDPVEERIGDALGRLGIRNVDVAMECVGSIGTMKDAIDNTGRGGTALLFGLTGPDAVLPIKPFELFQREVTVRTSFINPNTQARALSLLESGKVRVGPIITERVALSDIASAFDGGGRLRSGKTVVIP
ncbi:MAG: zinc-dependent alcohol dehydrogenase family protein [Oscillospiraceae bacterium]|nr:zinc-dependent alcohol dehydrogenase family protein [Oscillospiraceae bacterium]